MVWACVVGGGRVGSFWSKLVCVVAASGGSADTCLLAALFTGRDVGGLGSALGFVGARDLVAVVGAGGGG